MVTRASRSTGKVDGKMTRRTIIAVVLVTVLVFVAGPSANAQGLKQKLLKGMVKSMGPDAVQAMMTQVASEVAKNPELRKQLLEALGPETTKAIIASATGHGTVASPISAVPAVSRGPVRDLQTQVPVETASNPAVPPQQVIAGNPE